jgi:PAS domain S-box-containing protein
MSTHRDEPSKHFQRAIARGTEDLAVTVAADAPTAHRSVGSTEPRERRPARSRRARWQLDHLNQIGKLLIQFDSAEETVPAVLGIAGRAVPIDVALVVLNQGATTHPTMISWRAGGVSPAHVEAARAPGEAALAYFHDDMGAHPGRGASAAARLVSEAEMAANDGGPQPVALPLVAAGGRAFGVLEVLSCTPLDEADLAFVAAVADQLAVALGRHRAADARRVAAEANHAAALVAESLAREAQRRAERREAEAVQLQQRYQALVDNLAHAFVWVVEADSMAVTYVSAQVQRLLGAPVSAWEAGRFLDHIHPDDRAHVRAQFERVRREGKNRGFDARFVARDGSVRWFHTGVHLTESVGAQFHGVSVDVTGLKEVSLRAIERFEFNRALTDSMAEGVLAVDTEGRVTFVNRAGSSLLGWRSEDALAQPFAAVSGIQRVGGAPLGPGESPVERVIAGDAEIRCEEHLFATRGGPAFPVGYTATPIRRGGDVVGAVLVFRDVLDRQRDERLLRFLSATGVLLTTSLDRRGTLAAVVRSAVPLMADLCFIEELQEDGRVERVEVLFADPRQQHLAESVRQFASQLDWKTPGGRALRSGESVLVTDPRPDELAHDEAHASVVRACRLRSLMVVPLRARGKALGAITFATIDSGRVYEHRDLTLAEEIARRAAYAIDNARLYESAQRAVRARDEVMAVVAHDLGGPLGTILVNTDLLQLAAPGLSSSVRTRSLSAIERAGTRMKHLIGDLMDASALEAGQVRLEREPCDVGELLDEAADLHETVATQGGLELVCRPPAPDVELVCDRDRVLQVLGNLIGNALKFTRRGVIVIEAERRGGDVVFSVSDQGSGIAPADLPHVFDRYWRARETDRPGSGLGLSIVRGLVQAHAGEVWAESEPGRGSTFSFSIPLSPSPGPG